MSITTPIFFFSHRTIQPEIFSYENVYKLEDVEDLDEPEKSLLKKYSSKKVEPTPATETQSKSETKTSQSSVVICVRMKVVNCTSIPINNLFF